MEEQKATAGEARAKDSVPTIGTGPAPPLDAQFGELIETVWKCERQWATDERNNTATKYGRYPGWN